MEKVKREEIVDYVTYNETREVFRAEILEMKKPRRIHVGDELTFLFENHDTVRYQIQEMMRVEQIVKEADIQHEIDTYNELIGGPGGLGCSLLIEIADEAVRPARLTELLDLPKHLYAKLDDGTKVRPVYDQRQVGDDRVSSVQYLSWELGGRVPVALGCDHEKLNQEHVLTDEQHAALSKDLLGK